MSFINKIEINYDIKELLIGGCRSRSTDSRYVNNSIPLKMSITLIIIWRAVLLASNLQNVVIPKDFSKNEIRSNSLKASGNKCERSS